MRILYYISAPNPPEYFHIWCATTLISEQKATCITSFSSVVTNILTPCLQGSKWKLFSQPLQKDCFKPRYKQGHYLKPTLSTSTSQQGPKAFKGITAEKSSQCKYVFHVVPRGSICVLLSSDLSITMSGWRDCFQPRRAQSPARTDVCSRVTSWQGHDWTRAHVCICTHVHKAALCLRERQDRWRARWGGDGTCTVAGGAVCVCIPYRVWCMIEASTRRVAINQEPRLMWSCYSLELNSRWESVNLPVSFCCFFFPRPRCRLSVWYLFCFSFYPVTAESFNWVTTASPPWIVVLGSVWLVMLSCILSSLTQSPPLPQPHYTSDFTHTHTHTHANTPLCTRALQHFHLVWEYKWSISQAEVEMLIEEN